MKRDNKKLNKFNCREYFDNIPIEYVRLIARKIGFYDELV